MECLWQLEHHRHGQSQAEIVGLKGRREEKNEDRDEAQGNARVGEMSGMFVIARMNEKARGEMTDPTDQVGGMKTAVDMARIGEGIEEDPEMRCHRSRRIPRDHHRGSMVEQKKGAHIRAALVEEGVE
jgi:hypothetical protein